MHWERTGSTPRRPAGRMGEHVELLLFRAPPLQSAPQPSHLMEAARRRRPLPGPLLLLLLLAPLACAAAAGAAAATMLCESLCTWQCAAVALLLHHLPITQTATYHPAMQTLGRASCNPAARRPAPAALGRRRSPSPSAASPTSPAAPEATASAARTPRPAALNGCAQAAAAPCRPPLHHRCCWLLADRCWAAPMPGPPPAAGHLRQDRKVLRQGLHQRRLLAQEQVDRLPSKEHT